MSHTYTRLLYHCIFSTKGRLPLIENDMSERLFAYMGGILREHDARLLAGGGTTDHVHLLVELPSSLPVADAMRFVKANSSKWVRATLPSSKHFGWQTGYGAFSASPSSVDDIVRYINNQEEHHRSKTFKEEFVEFLRRHEIEFESQYLWE